MKESPTSSTPPSDIGALDAEKLESQPTSEPEQIPSPSLGGHLYAHLSEKVETRAGYIPLLICCFVTGLTDGTVYNGESVHQRLEIENTDNV